MVCGWKIIHLKHVPGFGWTSEISKRQWSGRGICKNGKLSYSKSSQFYPVLIDTKVEKHVLFFKKKDIKNEKLIEHASPVDIGRRFNIHNCLYDIEVEHEPTAWNFIISRSHIKHAMPVTELWERISVWSSRSDIF